MKTTSPDASTGTYPGIPKYQMVYNDLRKEIIAGRYKPGQKLPSEADLVKRFGASRITVGRAVKELQLQNMVERRAGSGTYVKETRTGGFSFGLLIPDLGRTEIFEPICQGMMDAPQAASHALIWGKACSDDSPGKLQEQAWQLCEQFIERNVSGIFFAPLVRMGQSQINHRIIAALEKARIPIVLLDRDYLPYPQRSPHDLVGINNRRTGFRVTEHLIKNGARRPMFVCYVRSATTIPERITGFREALHDLGLPETPHSIQRLSSEDSVEELRKIMGAFRPDALVCANDYTAGRVLQRLIALGHRIPQDVRVVGIDDVGYASLLPVPLTTMHQPCREIGMAAMSLMLERIGRPDMPVREVFVECDLIVRDSCGAKKT